VAVFLRDEDDGIAELVAHVANVVANGVPGDLQLGGEELVAPERGVRVLEVFAAMLAEELVDPGEADGGSAAVAGAM
jgi:hypothetical protein